MQGFERTGELLAKLSAIGAPILTQFEDGCWSARVKFPAPEGVTADVRSDFKHGTPEEALQVCIDRLGGLQDMISVPTPQPRVLTAIDA